MIAKRFHEDGESDNHSPFHRPSVRFHQTFNPRYVRLRSLHVPFKPTFFASKEAWNGVCGLSLSREKRRPPVFLDKGRASTSPSLVTNRFADYSRWQISQRSLSLSLSFFFFTKTRVYPNRGNETVDQRESIRPGRFGHVREKRKKRKKGERERKGSVIPLKISSSPLNRKFTTNMRGTLLCWFFSAGYVRNRSFLILPV